MPFPPTLSKTDYNRYLQCPKLLWLSKFRKDLTPPITEVQQNIFDQGHLVESYSHKLEQFANGTEVTGWYKDGRNETQDLINAQTKNIYQANAMPQNLYCKADILHFNNKTNKWDIYEVKSSSEVKDEHIPDLCFQKIAFERDGVPIDRTYLVHVNKNYVKNGEINPKELLKIEDITEDVENFRSTTEADIPKALAILKLAEEVAKLIGKQCEKPYECPFIDYCWKDVPEYNIFDLRRLSEKQLKQLRDLKIEKLVDIPNDFEMNEKQQNQVLSTKTEKPIIDKEAIKNALDALKYPLYFLDYESYMTAVPLFDGLKPYQQMCFQYSLHVIERKGDEREGDEPKHFEYLHTGKDHPVPALLKSMRENIGDTGSVIVWNKSFEMGRNKEMALMYPEYAAFLNSVNARVFDLMEIFKDQYYVDAGFKGSYSIKKVLPTLVPELSYDDLEDVREGGIASLYWFKHIYGGSEMRERVARNMLEYCKLDTLAMVEVWGRLEKI